MQTARSYAIQQRLNTIAIAKKKCQLQIDGLAGSKDPIAQQVRSLRQKQLPYLNRVYRLASFRWIPSQGAPQQFTRMQARTMERCIRAADEIDTTILGLIEQAKQQHLNKKGPLNNGKIQKL